MTDRFKTDQEAFWAGQFGDDYIARNASDSLLGSNVALLARMLRHCPQAASLIEFGANVGLNLRAVRSLRPDMELEAIEINETAVERLRAWGGARRVHHCSILEFQPSQACDIALIKGVLIHIDPDSLPQVYARLFAAASDIFCWLSTTTRRRSRSPTAATRANCSSAISPARCSIRIQRFGSSTTGSRGGAIRYSRKTMQPGSSSRS